MDADMEIDIPPPEELEWLEANSHIQADYESIEEADFYPEEEVEEEHGQRERRQQDSPLPKPHGSEQAESGAESHFKSPTSTAPAAPSDPRTSSRKRTPVDSQTASCSADVIPSGEKRSRTDGAAASTEIDEDWLRYSPPARETSQAAEAAPVEAEKVLSRFASEIHGECVPVTAPSGDRVYAKISRVERECSAKRLNGLAQSSGLLSEPIQVLLQKVEQDNFMKALEASSEGNGDAAIPEASITNDQLWVNKYAPDSFTELLSDEQTNREVLSWLKQWDSCVFGSKVRSTADEVLSALRRHFSISQHKRHFDAGFLRNNTRPELSNKTFRWSDNWDTENSCSTGIKESWDRNLKSNSPPEQKILLLCGSPGLGKTTLAHVAAKHCGYLVVEINASDDRSSSTVESKILDVVQMNSVVADSRPKCLVIDEIDGALGDGKGVVDVLLKMVSAEKRIDIRKANVAKGSKKRPKTATLLRPVICICNDLYAPALRPLRQVAKVHIFSQPTLNRVVSRLKYICHKEALKVSSAALAALSDYTECDIRSCLNTLHFLKKKNEPLNAMKISSQVVGRKDISRSAFDIWKGIFQKRAKKQEKNSDGRWCDSSSASKFDFLHSLISNGGNYDLIFDGIHENFLQLHYLDPVMQKTVNCLDDLGISDLIHNYTMKTQHTALYAYQPTIAIRLHSLIAQAEKPNIEWPKSFHRCRAMWMEKTEILKSWFFKINPDISRHLSVWSFVQDLVSPFLHILSPPSLRPVALHLLSEREKNDLSRLVSMMVSYSITYTNMKCDSLRSSQINGEACDSSALLFEPPIADFIRFKGYRSVHPELALAMKQILVHEVEKQKILQHSVGRGMNSSSIGVATRTVGASSHAGVNGSTKKNQSKPSGNVSELDSNRNPIGNPKLQSSSDVKKPRNGSHFFDRFRKLSSKGSENEEVAILNPVASQRNSHSLLFKFNEGFTNAIKRPVRIRDFLP